MEQLCAFSPATHQPRNPQTPYSTSTRKKRGRKEWTPNTMDTHPVPSALTNLPLQGHLWWRASHSPMQVALQRCQKARVALWLQATSPESQRRVLLMPGHRDLAWGAAEAGWQGSSDVTQPLAALLAFSLFTQNQRNGWLFNKSKPVSFFKLKFHRSSAYPMARCPQKRWKNNWNHMSQFD